jgi:16S rRNA (guanine966-N2)-methyltransferase
LKVHLHSKPSARREPKGSKLRRRVRIIGGIWRSRLIEFPETDGLRPTANRIRETLFNWLGQTLQGKCCLDLFSGSGALGFEAASRGAVQVVLLEQNPDAIGALRVNQQKLAADGCRIVAIDALKFLSGNVEKFDVVFVDPPFSSGLMIKVLGNLAQSLSESGMVYAEWGTPISDVVETLPARSWEIVKQGRAGAVHFALIRIPPISI